MGKIANWITKIPRLKNSKVARFSYKAEAYANDDIEGVDSYDYSNDMNVPLATHTDFDGSVLSTGARANFSSIPKNGLNHFFGRVSYNLNKVIDFLSDFLDDFIALNDSFISFTEIVSFSSSATLSNYANGSTKRLLSTAGSAITITLPAGETYLGSNTITLAPSIMLTITKRGTVWVNSSGNAITAITADKWRTARNVSISDADGTNTGAAVSVDGSENETLKLPATIKATLSGKSKDSYPIPTDAVLQYSFDEIGDVIIDNSYSEAHAENHGVIPVDGVCGKAGYFNNSYMIAPRPALGDDITIYFWAKLDALGLQTIVQSRTVDGQGGLSVYQISNSYGLVWRGNQTMFTGYTPPVNTWHHVCIKMNATTKVLKINGETKSTLTGAYGVTENLASTIWSGLSGTGGTLSGQILTGALDGLKIVPRFTTDDEDTGEYKARANLPKFYTTADKWKTARNITISDADGTNTGTVVSVDGSEDERLKLPATIKATLSGNADTADKWKTARNITISDADGTNTGTAVPVDGSENETLKLPPTIKANITGNATTATKLATARKIHGVDFDGTKNIYDTYSTTETRIGTWIDGTPLYRKVVNFGALPNEGYKEVAHGITNIGTVVTINYCLNSSDGYRTNFVPGLSMTPTFFTIVTDSNMSNMSTFVIIEYTKEGEAQDPV